MIEVCCAILFHENRLLAVQRGPNSSHPLKWEFPGGKIQENELPEQAIIREIDEELGIRIEVIDCLKSVVFDYKTKQVHLIPFTCRIVSGEIMLTEHLTMCWFEIDLWKTIDWAEADYELIECNLDSLTKITAR